MLLNKTTIQDIFLGIRAWFLESLESTSMPLKTALAMEVPSTTSKEKYTWMGAVPTLREWLDDRPHESLRPYKVEIENKKWANGLIIKRDDIEDDSLGLIRPQIAALARAALKHQESLLLDFLVSGFAATKGLAYDGQFFFDTDHKDGDGPTQSNKDTAALAKASFETAYQKMLEVLDERSEPLDITPTHLIVGPSNRAKAHEILQSKVIPTSQQDNPNLQIVETVISNRLTGAHAAKWFLADLGKDLKPFIFQLRRAVALTPMDDLTDEMVYTKDIFRFGVDGRYNAGYGLWQLAYGSDGTT